MTATGIPCLQDRCNPLAPVGDVLGKGAEALGGNLLQQFADGVTDALGKALAALGTLWVKVPTPNLTGGQGSDAVQFLQGSLWWWTAAAAIAATIVGGVKLALQRRAQPGIDVVRGLVTLTVVTAAGVAVLGLAIGAADGFSTWVIDRSLDGGDFGQNVALMLGVSSRVGGPGSGPVLVILLGLAAIFASFVQIMLMVARGGMLVLLAGVLPLAAAMSGTEAGRVWLRRAIAWTVAFVLYKPAAAIVYATAFRLVGTPLTGERTVPVSSAGGAVEGAAPTPEATSSSLVAVLTGLMLMLLALVALPALLRFLTPLVHATAGAGGHGPALVGAAATGAVNLAGRNRGSSRGADGAASGGGRIPTQAPAQSAAPTGAAGAATGGGAAAAAGKAAGPAGAAAGAAKAAGAAARRTANNATGEGNGS